MKRLRGLKAKKPHVVSADRIKALDTARFKYKNVGSVKQAKRDTSVFWINAKKGKRLIPKR